MRFMASSRPNSANLLSNPGSFTHQSWQDCFMVWHEMGLGKATHIYNIIMYSLYFPFPVLS